MGLHFGPKCACMRPSRAPTVQPADVADTCARHDPSGDVIAAIGDEGHGAVVVWLRGHQRREGRVAFGEGPAVYVPGSDHVAVGGGVEAEKKDVALGNRLYDFFGGKVEEQLRHFVPCTLAGVRLGLGYELLVPRGRSFRGDVPSAYLTAEPSGPPTYIEVPEKDE